MISKKVLTIVLATVIATPFYTQTIQAKEFTVKCSSVDDSMNKGNKLIKRRKLSLALEAYRNAIKKDVENKDAWRKFERTAIRISEEGGC